MQDQASQDQEYSWCRLPKLRTSKTKTVWIDSRYVSRPRFQSPKFQTCEIGLHCYSSISHRPRPYACCVIANSADMILTVHLAGHEVCGKVLSLGSKVPEEKGPRVGDVVVVYPWPGCGQCETCSTENWQLCDEHGCMAVNTVNGGSTVSDVGSDTNPSSLASFQVSNYNLIGLIVAAISSRYPF